MSNIAQIITSLDNRIMILLFGLLQMNDEIIFELLIYKEYGLLKK